MPFLPGLIIHDRYSIVCEDGSGLVLQEHMKFVNSNSKDKGAAFPLYLLLAISDLLPAQLDIAFVTIE